MSSDTSIDTSIMDSVSSLEGGSTSTSPTPSLEEEGEEEGEEVRSLSEVDAEEFKEWIGFVSRCLKGRLTEEDTGEATEKEEVVSLTETEQERNMRIVRSVIDEETALEMARNFIRLTKVQSTGN